MRTTCWRMIGIALCLVLGLHAHAQSTSQSKPPSTPHPAAGNYNLNFDTLPPGQAPAGWWSPDGWTAVVTEEKASSGARSVKLFKTGESKSAFGNFMISTSGSPYAGKRVKFSARVLVVGEGQAQGWLRVDRATGAMGAFDNMDDRPIRPGDWSTATIEADVEADAAALNVGVMAMGAATVYIDDVRLETSGDATPSQEPSAPKPLSARGLENVTAAAKLLSYIRFFHPTDAAVGITSWDHFAVDLMERAEPATDAADLAKRLTEALADIAPTVTVWAGSADQAPVAQPPQQGATTLARWRHRGAGTISSPQLKMTYNSTVERLPIDAPPAITALTRNLGGGVACRLPIAVPADAGGTLPRAKTPDRWSEANVKQLPKLTSLNRSTRLAGVALGWGVFQHFYPYFDVVETDWDAALPAALAKAAQDTDVRSYLYTLRELVAKLHDGHGSVRNPDSIASSFLPVSVVWLGTDLVINGKHDSVPGTVSVGDTILSIDGRPTPECYAEICRQISCATDGWARAVSPRSFLVNFITKDPVRLELRRVDGSTHTVELPRTNQPPADITLIKRPDNGHEVAPGIVYFDLCGTDVSVLNDNMPKLETAKAIIFDLRGYPNSAAFELMQHLIDSNATSARWCVPIVTQPDHEGFVWDESGRWPLEPKAPRLKGHIAFLTDGGAISYAESIMGIVEAYKMGEIVGATTAGTNGNINPFPLPGGFNVSWTGMKVLKHDGSRHHGVGIAPTVPVTPTPKGFAAGKDEVLDKAVEVMKAKIERGPAPTASPAK